MTGHRKKIVIFLMATALGSGLLAAAARLSATPAVRRPSLTEARGARDEGRAVSLFSNDPNFFTKASGNSATQELFLKTMLAVLVVIILGVTAIYTTKKLLPKITQSGALGWISTPFRGPGKQIHILETTHLGPKKTVHLIEVGNQQFLVGSTNENITMLAELDTRCSAVRRPVEILDTRQESSIENRESRM